MLLGRGEGATRKLVDDVILGGESARKARAASLTLSTVGDEWSSCGFAARVRCYAAMWPGSKDEFANFGNGCNARNESPMIGMRIYEVYPWPLLLAANADLKKTSASTAPPQAVPGRRAQCNGEML